MCNAYGRRRLKYSKAGGVTIDHRSSNIRNGKDTDTYYNKHRTTHKKQQNVYASAHISKEEEECQGKKKKKR